jgi:hypothetical protein
MRVRQRSQQDCVNHAEDRGVRANAERERKHGNYGEARILYELSNRIPNIV